MRFNSISLKLPPPDKKLVSTVSEVFNVILQKGYEKIKQVPLRKYPINEHLSVYEEKYSMSDLPALFSVSSNPVAIRENVLDSEILRRMYSAFFLNVPTEKDNFIELLGSQLFNEMEERGLLYWLKEGNVYRSLLRYVPDNGNTFVTSAFDRNLACFTYLSYDSITFAKFVKTAWYSNSNKVPCRILDYCCGVGYVGLCVMRGDDHLLGVDLNPNAIWMARLNMALQRLDNCRFENMGRFPKGAYDLITCNPPFVFMERSEPEYLDSNGGGGVWVGNDTLFS